MKRNQQFFILPLIAVGYFLLHLADMDLSAGEYMTDSGKSLSIEESHPQGVSLSNIRLNSSGFEHNLSEIIEDIDPIHQVYVTDLDGNGFDEFYIVTVSKGSGSYGTIIAYASNNDKSLSRIHFPEAEEGDKLFTGYMGHDKFQVSGSEILRSFPIYLPSDNNSNPTGGRRQLTYRLFPGEASWQLKIMDSSNIE
ncbi:MAG: hypothetical protein ACR2PH_14910 [Desulfobulbia bacterium]